MGIEIVGWSGGEEPIVVRLQGEENGSGFWKGRGVVGELEKNLRETLNDGPMVGSPVNGKAQDEKKVVKKGLFGKKGKIDKEDIGVQDRDEGQVRVEVGLEEVCLRTMSEFGLYETVARMCVVVRVDARC